jgi:spermidine/putrescine transport system permease protein
MVEKKSFLERFYVGIIFFLLYAPLAILTVCSFNASKSRMIWGGFTLDWYAALFRDAEVIQAFRNSLLLTTSAALIATLLGTMACIGLVVMSRKIQSAVTTVTNIPLLNADIVTGIALMLLFVRFMDLGFSSLLVAHVTLTLPYVILSVMPKLKQTNKATYEAALDLGATPAYAFFKIVLPEIMPGILSGFLLAFTMSLDDFVITYFTKGPGINTISTMIYQQVRRGINPEMYALSTLLFLTILIILAAVNHISDRQAKKQEKLYKY